MILVPQGLCRRITPSERAAGRHRPEVWYINFTREGNRYREQVYAHLVKARRSRTSHLLDTLGT